jgi:hypothetical protein
MRLSIKVLLLALIALGAYFAYTRMFAPFIGTGSERVKTFYTTVPQADNQ